MLFLGLTILSSPSNSQLLISSSFFSADKHTQRNKTTDRPHLLHTDPAQTTPEPLPGGHESKRALSRCKGDPERVLLVVKGHRLTSWRIKGRVTVERAT